MSINFSFQNIGSVKLIVGLRHLAFKITTTNNYFSPSYGEDSAESTSLHPCTSSCIDRQQSKYAGHRYAPAEHGGGRRL